MHGASPKPTAHHLKMSSQSWCLQRPIRAQPASPLSQMGTPGAPGNARGQAGSTHIVEHFVELLGVHDEVGVAYHVVDCVRLDGGDTEIRQ